MDWGGKGASSNQELFCIVSTNEIQKSLMFLHLANNIEHNIKQNIYTAILPLEVTFLIPP